MLLYSSEDSPIGMLNSHQSSLIVSLLCIGGTAGTIIFGFLADVFGRKWMLLLIAVPQLVANLLILIGTNYYFMFTARFLFGLAGGGCYVLVPMFVSEISHER